MAAVNWTKIKRISLARAARQVGFDISIYEDYSADTRVEVQKQSIKEVLEELGDAYSVETGRALKDVKRGVYVICLSNPFTIKYPKGLSEIIYIGRGNVLIRLKSHFENSLFQFMQSLSGTDFDVHIAEPKMRGPGKAKDYFTHVEFLLLNRFKEKFGGVKRKDWFPLLNKNAGSRKKLDDGTGWNKPLSRAGKTPRWELAPTKEPLAKL